MKQTDYVEVVVNCVLIAKILIGIATQVLMFDNDGQRYFVVVLTKGLAHGHRMAFGAVVDNENLHINILV